VWPRSIVPVDVWCECGEAITVVKVRPEVGPLADEGLDDALRFAVGLRSIGPGAPEANAVRGGDLAKCPGEEVAAVVREHAPDDDAPGAEVGKSAFKKRRGRRSSLVRECFDVEVAAVVSMATWMKSQPTET
jgi:hypothetical protein